MHSITKLTSSLVTVALLSACGGGSSSESKDIAPDNAVVKQSQETYNKNLLAKVTFTPASSALIELGGDITSKAVILNIQGEEKISIVNGKYSIDENDFTDLEGVIKNGNTLIIKQELPKSYGKNVTTTVTIGSTVLNFTNSMPKAPAGYVEVPEGAISINYTCQPTPSACSTDYTKATFYDANNTQVEQVDLVREMTSYAETGSDSSTIALYKPHETNQSALVFLSLDNQHYDFDALKGSVISRYEAGECKSYSVNLDGLSGYELKPSRRFELTQATNFDVVEYDKNFGTAKLSLTSCGNEGFIISEINTETYSTPAISYIDIPVNDIVEGDVISLTMKVPTLIDAQVDNADEAELASFISFNEDNTAYNYSSGVIGRNDFYLYPTANAHYVASISFNDIPNNNNFKNQFYNFSALPENNIFSEQMFDIEIETVAFDLDTSTLSYSVSGNDTPSIILFDLKITYQTLVDGVSKEYNTRTSIFSQHSTTSLSFPNVHEEFIPEGAEVIKVTGKLNVIKTTYFNDFNSAMGFGLNPNTIPVGLSSDDGASGFFTSEYFTFFEKD